MLFLFFFLNVTRELFHNNIAHLQPNAFDGLPQLNYLRIDRNAINCDCNIVELVNKFDHNRTRVHIICDTPQNLHGQGLNQFNAKDLNCGKCKHSTFIFTDIKRNV